MTTRTAQATANRLIPPAMGDLVSLCSGPQRVLRGKTKAGGYVS